MDINNDILIVDDEINNIRLLTELLEKEGYSVRPAYKSQSAIDAALAIPPGLILLAVRMPEIDGFEVCRRLKQDDRTRDIPIIFVSALNDIEARVKAFEVGGVDYINKPFEEVEILIRVKNHLGIFSNQKNLKKLMDEATSRYQMYLSQSIEGIYSVEFDEPINISLPEEEQCELIIKHGYMAEANDAYARHVGLEYGEQLVGTQVGDFLSPSEPKNIAILKSFIQGGYTVVDAESVESYIEGVTRNILNNAVGIIESGYLTKIWGTQIDITDYRKSEKALYQSKQFSRTVLNTIQDHIAVIDRSGSILTVNESWMKFARDNNADLSLIGTGVNYLDVCRQAALRQQNSEAEAESVKLALKGLTGVLNGDVNEFVLEYECHSPTEKRWFQMVILPFSGEKGGLVVTHRNITDLKRIEEKLLDAEQKYRTVADFTYDWEYWEAPDGSLVYVSPSCERITQHDVSEFHERPKLMSEIIVSEDQEIWNNHKHGEKSDSEDISCRFRIKRRDGEIRWIAHVCQPVYTAEGQFEGIRSSNRDITELQKAENQVNQHLAMLTSLDRRATLGQLAGSIAHELNQPLTGILGGAQAGEMVLDREIVDRNQIKELFSDIVSDTKRASQVIQHLRELFEGQSGNLVSINVNAIILETLQLLNSEIITKSVAIKKELSGDVPHLQANRIQLQQVLINLIRNACEAMQDVSMSDRWLLVKTLIAQDNQLELSILDNGPGIDPDHFDVIFEPLSQTSKRGMGMGLAISRSIIRAHQGEIWAGNSPDAGAHFRITLPMRSQ